MTQQHKTILVVEDNPQNLDLVEFLLDEAGYKVRKAMSAEEAREEMGKEIPDLVLLDIQLPGCDGLTLVSEFREYPNADKLPIVALTAHAMQGDRERFIASGCNGYISKPVNVGTFIEQVEAVLTAARDKF